MSAGVRDVHGGARSRARNDLVPARRGESPGNEIHRISPYGEQSSRYVPRKKVSSPILKKSPEQATLTPAQIKSATVYQNRITQLESKVKTLEEKNVVLDEKKRIAAATRRQMVNENEAMRRTIVRKDEDIKELERELQETQALLRQSRFDQGGELLLKREVKALEAYIKIREPEGDAGEVIALEKKRNPVLEAKDREIHRLRHELESSHKAIALLEREVERYAAGTAITRARLRGEQEWRTEAGRVSEVDDNLMLELSPKVRQLTF